MRIKSADLGDSVVLRLHFTTDEGIANSKMKKGQWVIIYGEIPARKLTGDKFAVYPNCTAAKVKSIEEKTKRQRYWDPPAYF